MSMRPTNPIAIARCIACCLVLITPALRGNDAEFDAIRTAVDSIADATVQIETIGADAGRGELSLGAPVTGTIIDPEGYVVTSLWGLETTPASILIVFPDDSRFPAEVVARDWGRELALLKFKPSGEIASVSLDRSGPLTVGQWAIAVGRGVTPAHPSVSVGILSAENRMFGRACQIDARISPSFYGGPVIDIQGQLIGISVPMKPQAGSAGEKAGWYDSGIAFVVPSEMLAARLERLKSGKDVRPGRLGIVPSNKMPFSTDTSISAVLALSPAKKAGLQAGDELLAINDQTIRWSGQIKQLLGPRDAGETVRVRVRREKEELEFDIELAGTIATFRPQVLGVLARQQDQSVVVDFVFPDSPADKAEIQEGDIISKVGSTEIDDVSAFRLRVTTQATDEPLTLVTQRDGADRVFECDLDTTPESVIDDLPATEPNLNIVDWQREERSLPDVPNKAMLLRPKSDSGVELGLLVLLARPGDDALGKIIDSWEPVAAEHHFAVLAITASDDRRWTPAESDVVLRLIQQTQKNLAVADQRIVAGGFGAGAEMALMVAFRQRELLRGAIVPAGTRPGGFSLDENDPSRPVQVLVVGGNTIPIWGRVIGKAGFPVVLEKSQKKNPLVEDPLIQEAVGRWIRSLERI